MAGNTVLAISIMIRFFSPVSVSIGGMMNCFFGLIFFVTLDDVEDVPSAVVVVDTETLLALALGLIGVLFTFRRGSAIISI